MARLPRAAILAGAGLLAALAPFAFADEPAPPAGRAPAPPPEAAPPLPPLPDPDPWLTITGASLSGVARDGSTAFVRMIRDGVTQLFRIDRAGGWPHRLTYRREGVDFASVAPDGKHVVLGYDKDGDENHGLFLMGTRDEDAGQERALSVVAGVQHGGVVWSQEGDRIFFRSNEENRADFHLVELRLADGAKRTVLARPGSWNVVDAAPGGKRLLVRLDRGGRDSSLYVLGLDDGNLVEVDPLPAGKKADVGSACFLGGFDCVAFVSDRGGEWPRPWLACLKSRAVRP